MAGYCRGIVLVAHRIEEKKTPGEKIHLAVEVTQWRLRELTSCTYQKAAGQSSKTRIKKEATLFVPFHPRSFIIHGQLGPRWCWTNLVLVCTSTYLLSKS